MGVAGKRQRFFRVRRPGLELPRGHRRPVVNIPPGWEIDFVLGRVLRAGYCTPADLNNWVYEWDDIWHMHDMLDLQDWLDWKHHEAAEIERKRTEGRNR